ncbi:DNA-processing protein DprA [Ralstonia nicotianae]|uniref:DNA-protecting protein DprA n=5 Tax=Ralstonia solanacearum species complex TaxID=3116862 RepID=A0A0S4U2H4_RALSL|nr:MULTISPECIES: DNA-processing protein DprA [Ralstonia]ANH34760.1 DNA processing protein DprA [Ralstonia solanacearum]AVV67719.1 DNA-protecting protein DprA [Ralstonia solanacearum OE1-1]AGH82598.1 Rossmann fold nucleotide-binding protein Smf possibly involved in DNA uptake [Ralstonia pseudosolanacearum FQY_4]API76228.1 DNA processing protein DprA [Ralstonia pseudosolanacearum]ASL73342.1 DNA protecting protein DprA [Ralstonia pseudosolanacearum]
MIDASQVAAPAATAPADPLDATRDPAELAAWLRLTETPGIGPVAARQLLAAFGLPQDIFRQSYAALAKVLPERQARALLAEPDEALAALIERTAAWAAEPGNAIFTLADRGYPPRLLELPDPPTLLYAKGDVSLLRAAAVGVVGARSATAQGLENARAFAQALSAANVTIVSGLALGIDAAAHDGALTGPGSTIAVVGTGLDMVYPARNRALAHHIAEAGLILSEYPLGMGARAENFPRRNRLIAGLARGLLVVEAAAQSGSLITARLAAEQGRDVFAIPGSIHSPLAKGCHLLIKQGAKLVETAADILDELGWSRTPTPATRTPRTAAQAPVPASAPAARPAATAAETALLDALGFDPVDLDTLCERTGQTAANLSAQLLALELAGHIERQPGGRFLRLP